MENALVVIGGSDAILPVPIAAAGDQAARRFIEFFTANIRNPNTRTAYLRAVSDFFGWTEKVGLHQLETLEPVQIKTGITDHTFTQVEQVLKGSLNAGDTVVIGAASVQHAASGSATAPGLGGMGGNAARGARVGR